MRLTDRERFENGWRKRLNEYVYKCPIRLYDLTSKKQVDRSELFDILTTDVSTEDQFKLFGSLGGDNQLDYLVNQHLKNYAYATLSHRWGKRELTLSDLDDDLKRTKKVKPESHAKFEGFCNAAKEYGCRFVWIDTACIDKTNSVELEESIRSMFSWYEHALVCIVYLGDTIIIDFDILDPWFGRGWTLQELLAPKRLKFYFRDWSKCDPTTHFDIDRTMSPSELKLELAKEGPLLPRIAFHANMPLESVMAPISPRPEVAQDIFNYISYRQTSRPEDIAYCLLGLLGVQMPIAYGEGAERAFYRLQVACAQDSPSRALFHWSGDASRWNTMLPCEPKSFADHGSSDIQFSRYFSREDSVDDAFAFTNNGLHIMMCLFPIKPTKSGRSAVQEYSCEITPGTNTFIRGTSKAQSQASSGEAFVGVYGFDDYRVYAVLLVERTPQHIFTRIDSATFVNLPSRDTILQSKAAPRWLYIQ